MSTITDIPYDEHRLIVVVAFGFLLVALALPWRRARVQPVVLRVMVAFLPSIVLAFAGGVVVAQIAWAGEPRLDMLPLSGAICALGWGTGMLLRLAIARRALALVVLLPMLVVGGLLWTRDAPPTLSATAATRAFASQAGVSHFRCHRFASGDGSDLFGLSPAQFECDSERSPAYCAQHHDCLSSYISFDSRGRIRTRESPGAP
jgi:hypothetical protein